MKKFRILRLTRIVISLMLGFLLPLGYAFVVHTVTEYLRTQPHDGFLIPFGWPRPVWVLVFGPPLTEDEAWLIVPFAIGANVIVYGMLVYIALSVLAFIRSRGVSAEAPPPAPTFQ